MGYRVFRTTYKDRKGKTQEAAKWYVEFRDNTETVRRLPTFISKAALEEMGRNLEKLVAYHKASGGQTDPALTRFLMELPAKTREKLVVIGLLAAERVTVGKPLREHLDDFGKALEAKGNTPFHVEVITKRARRIIEGCGFRFYSDLSASKVLEYLHGLRQDTEDERGISAQTFNFYLQAVKQFCRWMVKDRRASELPLSHLEPLNVQTDRRHDRRELTEVELPRLLKATRASQRVCRGLSGRDRYHLYATACGTGFRAEYDRHLMFSLLGSILRGRRPLVNQESLAMPTQLLERQPDTLTVQIQIPLSRSMLDTEAAIPQALNEAGVLATQAAL
jgi:hypothetical protein